ncbi:site-specific integrase, partial [Salmonella enterica]|nr:site-specific integrase [Salmonella enterica]
MKVSIEKRQPDREGKRSLRLVYYYGSNVEDGQRKLKRSHEPLDIFIYDKPRSPAEREHNKEALRIAEAVRSKRLLESETSKHKLEDRTKLSASFFDYYDSVTDSKASGSKSNYSIWISAGHHLRRYHGRAELTFEDIDRAFLEGFKTYLLKSATTKSDQLLSRN